MKYAICVRDYIYTAPKKGGQPRLLVNAYCLCVMEYDEAIEHITRMRLDFAPVGWCRDYWLVPEDGKCVWTFDPVRDEHRTSCGVWGELGDMSLFDRWCPRCERPIREVRDNG